MSNLKKQLIRLGERNPNLRNNLKPILDKISSQDEYEKMFREFAEIMRRELGNVVEKFEVRGNTLKMEHPSILENYQNNWGRGPNNNETYQKYWGSSPKNSDFVLLKVQPNGHLFFEIGNSLAKDLWLGAEPPMSMFSDSEDLFDYYEGVIRTVTSNVFGEVFIPR